MGNTPSSPHPKTDLYPYMGYGAISPELDEQAFFDDIIDQPLVSEAAMPAQQKRRTTVGGRGQRKSWESVSSSSSLSNKAQRLSMTAAIDSAIDAWQRVKPRRGSYGKIKNKQMIGIEWEAE
ncbi:unnamed protein product [Discula destructiva]